MTVKSKSRISNKSGAVTVLPVISYSAFKTRFGTCLVASTDAGVCNILFADNAGQAIAELESRWLKAKLVKKPQPTHRKVEKYLEGVFSNESPRAAFPKDIPLDLKGTDFQKRVWKQLMRIPASRTSTYGEIARQLGDAKLARAVGGAVGKNPIGCIIPCHRVLASSGKIGGFRWGVERKKAMLEFESGK